MQLDWHDLKTNGSPALLRALKHIETTLTQQEADIAELQHLVSEDLMADLTQPAAPQSARSSRERQVIEDLGHGWRIERCASRTPAPGNLDPAGNRLITWLAGPTE